MNQIIYLAGGCFWGVEKYISSIRGVTQTQVGYANGTTQFPTYQQVRFQHTGHAETVRVDYDPQVLPLKALLRLFFRIIDPTSLDRQGPDVGHQYRTGIYYTDQASASLARESLEELAAGLTAPLAVECLPLEHFFIAEEYHQNYLDKNPGGYCHVPLAEIQWVKTVNPMDDL